MTHPHNDPKPSVSDPVALRSRLAGTNGPRYWRGLEELAESEEFFEFLSQEFPRQSANQWHDGPSRRRFLQLMSASLALAGVGGCAVKQAERIVPYVKAPEELVLGKPLFFATAMTLGGFATGLLIESHEGRPTKAEGNPLHPASLGTTDPFAQAEPLSLYDAERSQAITRNNRPSSWNDFQLAAVNLFNQQRASGGAGLRILTGTITSPTLAHEIRLLLEDLPEARWHQYEPVHRDHARLGALMAFGEDVQPRYDVEKADVILTLDADFLGSGPSHLPATQGFANRRDPDHEAGLNRLYVVECMLTTAGAKADHRLPMAAGRIADFALALAREVGVEGTPALSAELPETARRWIGPLSQDLQQHEGRSLILAGDGQPPIVHALAHALNDRLGNVGQTVTYSEPVLAGPVEGETVDQTESLRELVRDMDAGQVETLVILGVNPVYDSPADIPFRQALLKRDEQNRFVVPMRIHNGLYEDETAVLCQWHVPQAHFLEAWGDARAFDGTTTIQQPLIEPLFGGRSALQIVAALRGRRDPDGLAMVRQYWMRHEPLGFPLTEEEQERAREGEEISLTAEQARPFEVKWREAVHDGLIAESALPAKDLSVRPVADWEIPESAARDDSGIELVFAPDPTIYDGRYANNGWLQELPKPLTKLTWDNALMVSPAFAESQGLKTGDIVRLIAEQTPLEVPVWVQPGHAEGAVTLHLGYGRTRAGRVGTGLGFNAYRLRRSNNPWIVRGAQISRTDRTYELATTQLHGSLEGRNHVRAATLDQYQRNPEFVLDFEHDHSHDGDPHPSMYPDFPYNGYAWGMTIDLNRCVGCNACVIGCQAENNIPIVGKEEVIRGRAMHWLELDRYYGSVEADPIEAASNPEVAFQPRLCMHCERAPCEVVCPVEATVHDHEGLNNMVYNRCVGTRYCSNNCPYKVRHFNFLDYNEFRFRASSEAVGTAAPLALLMNPEVTVRALGVMEKCTYCVQRINKGKIQAELEDRKVVDGEIVTACQQACPAQAIVFGDINDSSARVSELKKSPRNYAMLSELNTRPRTSYLAMVKNPNPELEAL